MKKKIFRFPDFYEALLGFTKEALRNYIAVNEIETNVVEPKRSGFSFHNTFEPLYILEIEKMRATNEYVKCSTFLSKYNEIEDSRDAFLDIVSEGNPKLLFEHEYLIPFVERFAKESGLDFKLELFDEMYEQLELFLINGKVEYLDIFLLPDFKSEVNQICLAEGLTIKKMDLQQKKGILKELGYGLGAIAHPDLVSVLSFSSFILESTRSPQSKPIEIMNEVCFALNIFKPRCQVNYCGGFEFRLTWFKRFIGFLKSTRYEYTVPYYLNKKDVENFLQFWKNEYLPVKHDENHFLNISISRFCNFRYTDWTEGLLDLVISLESLYLTENDELSYRLSIRTASLLGLGKGVTKKDIIRNFIKKAYDIRSDIVHGGRADWKIINKIDPDLKPYDFVAEVKEYVRESIVRFLAINRLKKLSNESGKKAKEYYTLLESIDCSVYSDSTLREFIAS